MSAAADCLRALEIFNPHNACIFAAARGGTGIYLDYRPQQPGRGFVTAAWQVIRPGFKTDPNAHWQDRGHKTFTVGIGGNRAEAEARARTWAGERYGITEWVKVPGLRGALFPAGDAQIIRDALKAASR